MPLRPRGERAHRGFAGHHGVDVTPRAIVRDHRAAAHHEPSGGNYAFPILSSSSTRLIPHALPLSLGQLSLRHHPLRGELGDKAGLLRTWFPRGVGAPATFASQRLHRQRAPPQIYRGMLLRRVIAARGAITGPMTNPTTTRSFVFPVSGFRLVRLAGNGLNSLLPPQHPGA